MGTPVEFSPTLTAVICCFGLFDELSACTFQLHVSKLRDLLSRHEILANSNFWQDAVFICPASINLHGELFYFCHLSSSKL